MIFSCDSKDKGGVVEGSIFTCVCVWFALLGFKTFAAMPEAFCSNCWLSFFFKCLEWRDGDHSWRVKDNQIMINYWKQHHSVLMKCIFIYLLYTVMIMKNNDSFKAFIWMVAYYTTHTKAVTDGKFDGISLSTVRFFKSHNCSGLSLITTRKYCLQN